MKRRIRDCVYTMMERLIVFTLVLSMLLGYLVYVTPAHTEAEAAENCIFD